MFFRHRNRQPEIMDQPGLPAGQHSQALDGLARINRLSGSARILWPSLVSLARQHTEIADGGWRMADSCHPPSAIHHPQSKQPRPWRILDIASGGGDVLVALWQRARKKGLAWELAGCDISPVALDHARTRAQQAQANLAFFRHDILNDTLPPSEYDVVMCSLFLHHLSADEAVLVLRRMAEASRHLILVNDLARGTVNWLLVYAGTRLLTRSPVVHVDGPRSVAAAFTPAEARQLAEQAGLQEIRVQKRWPCRWLLTGRRP